MKVEVVFFSVPDRDERLDKAVDLLLASSEQFENEKQAEKEAADDRRHGGHVIPSNRADWSPGGGPDGS